MKRITLALAALIITIGANAQLLWKISGNGLTKPSYLFGTHHVAPLSVIDSVPGLMDALAAADVLYGEVDMEKMTDGATQMKMAQKMMAPADSTLSKVLSAEELAAIDNLFKENGLPYTTAQLEVMKPAAVSNIITLIMAQKANPGFNPNAQIDMMMQQRAKEKGKEVKGLETIDSQLDILFGSPISEQAKSLMETVNDPGKSMKAAVAMTNAYLAGNLAELDRMMHDPEIGMDAAEADRLINRRNGAWVEFMIGVLPTASIIAVVGAGHLPGDKGVINLLRKAGYKVEPADTL